METSLLYKQLMAFVSKRVSHIQDAEDIVQDVFLKAQLKSHQLEDHEKLLAWMYTITRNGVMDFYRSKKKVPDPLLINTVDDYEEFNACVSDCVEEVVASLPPAYKQALELTEFENLPQKELAQKLGISYSGAKSRVQRARQMLREKMEEQYFIKTDGYGNIVTCKNQNHCDC